MNLNEWIDKKQQECVDRVKAECGIDLFDASTRQKVLFLWGDAYLNEMKTDHHQVFADLLRVPRNSAKTICYLIHYLSSSPASKHVREKGVEDENS